MKVLNLKETTKFSWSCTSYKISSGNSEELFSKSKDKHKKVSA